MSAPLSIGELDGCIVACPLHDGRFDLVSGDTAQMPTTGGLDADGVYHPTWSPAGRDPKVDPPGKKAEARRLTRVRRFRYYPVRVVDGVIEVALPSAPRPPGRPSVPPHATPQRPIAAGSRSGADRNGISVPFDEGAASGRRSDVTWNARGSTWPRGPSRPVRGPRHGPTEDPSGPNFAVAHLPAPDRSTGRTTGQPEARFVCPGGGSSVGRSTHWTAGQRSHLLRSNRRPTIYVADREGAGARGNGPTRPAARTPRHESRARNRGTSLPLLALFDGLSTSSSAIGFVSGSTAAAAARCLFLYAPMIVAASSGSSVSRSRSTSSGSIAASARSESRIQSIMPVQ